MENKKVRETFEGEIIGTIKYLKRVGERVSVRDVGETVRCQPNIHKGFKKYTNVVSKQLDIT